MKHEIEMLKLRNKETILHIIIVHVVHLEAYTRQILLYETN
jgi:hypothetical protein